MLKKILFLIVLFPFVSLTNIAISDIIPLIKPSQTTEETEKKLLIDVLKPLPKPIKKTQEKKIEKEDIAKQDIKINFLLPKKKPLIAGSEKPKNIKISKYYNKKDFSLANKAISEMKKAKWTAALKTAKKLRINQFIILYNGDTFLQRVIKHHISIIELLSIKMRITQELVE